MGAIPSDTESKKAKKRMYNTSKTKYNQIKCTVGISFVKYAQRSVKKPGENCDSSPTL